MRPRKPDENAPAKIFLYGLLALLYGMLVWKTDDAGGPFRRASIFYMVVLLLLAGAALLRYVLRKRRWKQLETAGQQEPAVQEELHRLELRHLRFRYLLWTVGGCIGLVSVAWNAAQRLVNNAIYMGLVTAVLFGIAYYYFREYQALRGTGEADLPAEIREKRRKLAIGCAALVCAAAAVLWIASTPRRYLLEVRNMAWAPTTRIQVDYDGVRPTRTLAVTDHESQLRIYAALKSLTYEGRTEDEFATQPEDQAYEVRFYVMDVRRGKPETRWIHLRLLTAEPGSYDDRPRYTLDYENGDIVLGGAQPLVDVLKELMP